MPRSCTGKGVDIEIEVALAVPGRQQVIALRVPAGCTAREAVTLACAEGLDLSVAVDLDTENGPLGVFGRHVDPNRVVSAGDRVELYRPLQQDPMERRRQRAAEARARTPQRSPPPPKRPSEQNRRRRPRSNDSDKR